MQQRITEFKDKLRAGIDVGKWRAQALKLGYNRTNREKERKQAIEALGVQAWQQRIEHPDYADTFADLVALEQQRAGIQANLAAINGDIQREEARKQQLDEQFSPRIHELEQQKKAAAERQAAQEEMSQYDQQLAALKEEQQKALQPMQDRLAELRQQARNEQSQIAELEKQFTPLQHSLGEQVDRVRPESSDLHEHYARIDALNQDIARTADEIDTLNQRIGTAGAGALRPLYWLAGGAVVTVLVLVLIVPMIIGGAGSSDLFGSGTVSERQIREDLVGRTLGTPFYGSNLNWSIEDNSIQSLNVIERRTDRNAGTEDIHAELELANDIYTVRALVELHYKEYEQGWVLERVFQPENDREQLIIVSNRSAPDIDRLGNDIERIWDRTTIFGCDDGDPLNLNHSHAYGGVYRGGHQVWYELRGSACGVRATWRVIYDWDGNSWVLNDAFCRDGTSSYCH